MVSRKSSLYLPESICRSSGRVSYELSDDNRRWLELLTAFGILNGHYPSQDEIMNESIQQYFMRVYEDYCSKADPNVVMKKMMEEVISCGHAPLVNLASI